MEAPDVESMGVKALRELISSAGLSYADCIEKSDLRVRAREAQARLAAASEPAPGAGASGGGGPREAVLGGYQCVVTGGGQGPVDMVIVMLHGFGASNSDFVDMPSMASSHPGMAQRKIGWVFPQAPVGAAGASCWWHLDLMQWMGALAQGADGIARLIREEPEGLVECRKRMLTLLRETSALFGDLPMGKFVLSGFSQGAMTAMDLALQLPKEETVAGVTVISGCPIVVDQWAQRLPDHKGIKVHVTHGQADPVLPFMASAWNKELLEKNGASVSYQTHSRGHELGDQATIESILNFWATAGI
mmetsp:Transcript_691/g.2195  ORF Transcript_691/g.2195 Transcript_691/m.2195 type:complete len:304 (-) Transcript_691:76-987(-)